MTDFIKIEADLTGVFSGSVATGDFDGDGDRDILITGAIGLENEGTIFIEDQTSKIYINDGTGGFSEDTEANLIGVDDSSVATGDFDGDGDLDLLITGESEGGNVAKIYLNDGAGGFSEDTEASLTGVESGSVSVGDFDGDNVLDLLITGRTGEIEDGEIAEIYINDGAGGFSEDTEASLTGVEFSTTSTGDFDDDGDLDLLITGFDNVANSVSSIYLNDGLGGFSKDNSNSLVGVSFGSVATGDFDGDSDIDLFLTGNGSRTGQFYTNDGTGSFSLNTDANPDGFGNFDGSISTGDYDNDGDLDLLVAGLDDDRMAAIYTNDGTGVFSEDTETALTGVAFSASAVSDFDGDDDLDLLITGLDDSGSATAEIYLNNTANDNTVGNPGADIMGDGVLVGTPDADTITSGAGNDVIFALNGDDTLTGGAGDDRLHGQSGKDMINGEAGDDTLFGGNGFDRLNGGDGSDYLDGRNGIAVYTGGAGDDVFVINNDDSVDWIRDYELGTDLIGITDGLTYSDLDITGNVNSFIEANGKRIGVVLGVSPNELSQVDFAEL